MFSFVSQFDFLLFMRLACGKWNYELSIIGSIKKVNYNKTKIAYIIFK